MKPDRCQLPLFGPKADKPSLDSGLEAERMDPGQSHDGERPQGAGGVGSDGNTPDSQGRDHMAQAAAEAEPIVIPIYSRTYVALLSPPQVAERWGLTPRKVSGLLHRGTLPRIEDGRRKKIRFDDAVRVLGQPGSAATDTGKCPSCEGKDAEIAQLRRETFRLRSELKTAIRQTARANDQAEMLADAIERGCTELPEVVSLVTAIRSSKAS